MTSYVRRDLRLAQLRQGLPGVSREFGAVLAQAAAVCFEKHPSGVELKVDGTFKEIYKVFWSSVTEQDRRTWNDLEVATEHGAYGVAFLLILDLTQYTILERSRKGTGFDYWLGERDEAGLPPFQNKARLEVSGILAGREEVAGRVKEKLRQVRPSDTMGLPAYIVVVEFGTPLSQVVRK